MHDVRLSGDRSLAAYLRAVRRYPGFALRLLSAAALVTGGVLRNGVVATVVLVAGTVALALPLGWWRYRRTGRV